MSDLLDRERANEAALKLLLGAVCTAAHAGWLYPLAVYELAAPVPRQYTFIVAACLGPLPCLVAAFWGGVVALVHLRRGVPQVVLAGAVLGAAGFGAAAWTSLGALLVSCG